MSAKNNLNKAMFDMFGVGKEQDTKEQAANAVKPAAAKGKEEKKADVPVSKVVAEPKIAVPATYIAPSMEIEGNIRAKGDVEIAGVLKGDVWSENTVTVRSNIKGNITAKVLHLINCVVTGDIVASGDVIITESSTVNGNIKANSLSCSGKINGDIVVNGNLSLDSGACVIGNVSTVTMVVARGAVIKGKIEMNSEK